MKGGQEHTNDAFEPDSSDDVTLKSVIRIGQDDGDISTRKISNGEHHRWQNQIYVSDSLGGLRGEDKASSARGEAKITDTSSSGFSSEDSKSITEESAKGALNSNHTTIAILGSGDFGRALAGRLVQSGFTVNVGSRDPKRNEALMVKTGAHSCLHDEAIKSSSVIIVAIPKDFYEDLPLDMLVGKTVIDVSNRNTVARKTALSQAEYLQSLIPDSHVVKAFNVLSAYALESGGIQGSKEVFVAGEDYSAKETVTHIIRACGFIPVDMGALRSAREIEDIPVQRFQNWKQPLIISALIFFFLWLLAFGKFQICWTITWGDGSWHWERWNYLPMDTLNKTLSVHAITLLAACYLPGVIAAYIQIIRGTKYSRFPKWLDRWLKMRKQLGLLMLFSACLHACISVAIMSAEYQDIVYGYPNKIEAEVKSGDWQNPKVEEKEIEIYGGKMKWRGEMFLVCGVFSFALAVILGITSLPSVTSHMTWKEFAFVQSKLGWICMLLACAHNLFYGWPYINHPSCYIPSSFQYCMYLPGLTILLKIPLLFLSGYLDKIRGGWERGKGQKTSMVKRVAA